MPPLRSGCLSEPEWIIGFSQTAERCGFDALVLPEHVARVVGKASPYPYQVVGGAPATGAFPDPLETLSFVAAVTERLGLASGVLILPEHHPIQLAKRLATLDALSCGRVRAGVGVGWDQAELDLFGVDGRSRGDRADEVIEALRLLWSDSGEAGASFEGRYMQFQGVLSFPKPHRPEGIPVFVGGSSRRAARRAGRLGDGYQPLDLEGAELTGRVRDMREAASRAGRNPDALELALRRPADSVTAESIEADGLVGATRLIVSVTETADLPEASEALEAFAERVGMSRG